MAQVENSSVSGEASVSSDNLPPPGKKRRSLPGMPDPESEVIALSPKSLMATNRFACEICGKGFQRDQNLQLHRRGHNLPWKLRQRASNEPVRKRVYVCPEPSCIHHSPARALGDLTGIKKHFCRKHGDKKWSCERCSKKYAVQSDWKAHMKICGSREYKCDCGTLFSRRDSFIKHRAFCDALAAEESSRALTAADNHVVQTQVPSPPPPHTPSSAGVVSPALSIQSSEMPENKNDFLAPVTSVTAGSSSSSNASVFASLFASSAAGITQPLVSASEPTSLSLYLSDGGIFQSPANHYAPALSATALLQKAAQMGSNESMLRGLGLSMSGADGQEQWSGAVKAEGSYSELMMGHLQSRPATVDFLGLGMGMGGSTSGLSALLTSGCFNEEGGGRRRSPSPDERWKE